MLMSIFYLSYLKVTQNRQTYIRRQMLNVMCHSSKFQIFWMYLVSSIKKEEDIDKKGGARSHVPLHKLWSLPYLMRKLAGAPLEIKPAQTHKVTSLKLQCHEQSVPHREIWQGEKSNQVNQKTWSKVILRFPPKN